MLGIRSLTIAAVFMALGMPVFARGQATPQAQPQTASRQTEASTRMAKLGYRAPTSVVEPDHVLTYVWGLSVVEWTLDDTPDGCRYRFVHAGQEDRGVDAGEEGLPAGWHDFLDRFDRHLDGVHLSANERTANWQRLKPLYRERLDRVLVPRRVNH